MVMMELWNYLIVESSEPSAVAGEVKEVLGSVATKRKWWQFGR